MIDMELLEKGEKYENLNASYIIFICTFDPFGRNLPMYTFTHCCEEENTIKLKDGETRLFLNSKGSENARDPEIAAFSATWTARQPRVNCPEPGSGKSSL